MLPPKLKPLLKFTKYVPIMKLKFIRDLQIKKIRKGEAGPTEEELKNGKSLVWGRVEDSGGNALEAVTVGPNGYALTAHSALLIAQRVLSGSFKPGFMTPAKAYGANFILEVPCTELRDVSPS